MLADIRNDNNPYDKRIDLPVDLKADLRAAGWNNYGVVCFTHLDDDHCCGAGDFFWLDHAAKYQSEGRIKIKELWVPSAAILDDSCEDGTRIVRQEARHRLRQGYGIRVFSRPKKLADWLAKQGLSLESRAHLITDAGQYVPGFSKTGHIPALRPECSDRKVSASSPAFPSPNRMPDGHQGPS